uniref:DUF7507 domain-containing protein n=1 Tax=Pseudooceanicola sp. MF1-13 TaxID=3379095 RepID=UPI003891A450
NSATVSGTPPSGPAVEDVTDNGDDTDGNTTDDATLITPPPANPALQLVLLTNTAPGGVTQPLVPGTTIIDMDGDGAVSSGDRQYYTYQVTNVGDVTISGIRIDDPDAKSSGGPITLAPGAADTTTFFGYKEITQINIDAGTLSNQAMAIGSSPAGTDDVSDLSDDTGVGDDATVVTFQADADVTLLKTATLIDSDGTPGTSAGDRIDYVFEVANAGKSTLENILITEVLFTGTGTLSQITRTGGDLNTDNRLNPNETWSYSASYTITAADMAGPGMISNSARVSTETGDGRQIRANSASEVPGVEATTVVFLGTVAGEVRENSQAVPGVQVNLVDTATRQTIMTTVTGSDGRYALIDIPAGNYDVEFIGTDGKAYTGVDAEGNGLTGTINAVRGLSFSYPSTSADRDYTGINAVAIDPSGVIYDSETRQPLAGASVTLAFNGAPVNTSWLVGGQATQVTGADGTYAFFLQSPAQSGTYTIEVTYAGYSDSVLLPPQAGAYVPGLGGGIEQIVSSATAPAVGDPTVYYTAVTFTFGDWTNAATLSNGIIHNHIALDADRPAVIPQIENQVKEILENDLRLTVERQSRQFAAISRSALQRLKRGELVAEHCGEQAESRTVLNADGNDTAVVVDIDGERVIYDCAKELWIREEIEVSYDKSRDLGHQVSLSFTQLRERFETEDKLRGRFWGGYASRTSVAASGATGKIDGFGLNVGTYGAERHDGLYLDYYGAIAAGRHAYALNFGLARDIEAEGAYGYLAVFAGVGLSGEMRQQDWIIAPTLRLDMAHAFAGKASLAARYSDLAGAWETGTIALNDQSLARLTGEIVFSNDLSLANDGIGVWDKVTGEFSFAPRLFCDFTFDRAAASCGVGGNISYREAYRQDHDHVEYRVDYERRGTGDYSLSAGVAHQRKLKHGRWSNEISVTQDAKPKISTQVSLDF